jgi:hypothetical protein
MNDRKPCTIPGCFGTMGLSDHHRVCTSCRKGDGPVRAPYLVKPNQKERRRVCEQLRAKAVFGFLA